MLPEKWPVLGTPEQTIAGAEPFDGPILQWAQEHRARARRSTSSPARSPSASRATSAARNTSVHVGPDGELKATYRKIHMFDVEVGGRVYKESEHEAPGDEIVLSETASGTGLGLTICYDVRFPELYRILAVQGAEIVAVPAAFTFATTRDHWEILLRARAIEGQAFVVAANQIGEHAPGIRSGGRSMIVDPWGVVLATAPDTRDVRRRRARPGAPGGDPPHAALAGQPASRGVPLAGRGARRSGVAGRPSTSGG